MRNVERKKHPETNVANVVVWGPLLAGKHWLVWSFARELEAYNQNHPDFRYELFERYPGEVRLLPIRIETPSSSSHEKKLDFSWTFRRFPLQADRGHQISAGTHDLTISIIPGKESVEALFNPVAHETYSAMLNRAHHVIALLDPMRGQLPSSASQKDLSQDSISQKKLWSHEEYITVIHALLENLVRREGYLPSVAFGITKMDQIAERGSPWDIVEQRFGKQMHNLLQYYSTRLKLDIFPLSAHGLHQSTQLSGDEKQTPIAAWQPINTVAPFFFFFQHLEQTALQQRPWVVKLLNPQDEKSYIPYQMTDWQLQPAKELDQNVLQHPQ